MELSRELERCRAVLFICSKNWADSKWCFAEAVYARLKGKALFPLELEQGAVPSLLKDRQAIRFFQDEEAGYEQLWQGLVWAGIDPKEDFAWNPSRSPYPGFLAFDGEDAAVFFGREKEIHAGLDLFTVVWDRRAVPSQPRLIVILGPSGSGKSSLARAGILPQLRKQPDRWVVHEPVKVDGDFPDIAPAGGADEPVWVLLADQFEQWLAPGRGTHLKALREALSRSVVLATLRSDYLAAFQQSPQLEGLPFETLLLAPVSREALSYVIARPAERAGLRIAASLVDKLKDGFANEESLPLLAFVLRDIYERRAERMELGVDLFDEKEGLRGALERRSRMILAHRSEEELSALRSCLMLMLDADEHGQLVRRPLPRRDVPEAASALVEDLVRQRFLVAGQEALTITHDRLCLEWNFLKDAADDYGPFLRWRSELRQASETWRRFGSLLPEEALPEAERWLQRHPQLLFADERELITSSIAHRRKELEEARRHAQESDRALARQLALHAEVALKQHPQRSVLLAMEGLNAARRAGDDCTLASAQALVLLKGLANCGGEPVSEFQETSAGAFSSDSGWLATITRGGIIRLWDLRTRQQGQARSLAEGGSLLVFGPDDRRLIAGRVGGSLTRVELITGAVQVFGELGRSVAVSPNNRWVATAADNTIRLWDLLSNNPAASRGLSIETEELVQIAVSADGFWLATGDQDGKLRLFDLRTARPEDHAAMLTPHDCDITALIFSPDNRWLVSGSIDGKAQLWRIGASRPAATTLLGHAVILWRSENRISTAFSPNSEWLATESESDRVQVWSLTDGRPGTNARTTSDTFVSISNRWLATAGPEGIQLWDLRLHDYAAPPIILRGHEGPLAPATISPDDRWLLVGNRLWDLTISDTAEIPVVVPGHSTYGAAIAVSARNPRWLVTAGHYELIRNTPEAVTKKLSPSLVNLKYGIVQRLAAKALEFGARHRRAAVRRHIRGIAHSIGGRAQLLAPYVHPRQAPTEYSPKLIAPEAVVLWDLTRGRPAKPHTILRGHKQRVSAIAISPDNRWLATGGEDTTARLWDLTAPNPEEKSITLTGQSRTVDTVVFSSDSRWLAIGQFYNGDIGLLNIEGDSLAGGFHVRGPTNSYLFLAFSLDNRWLAVVSQSAAWLGFLGPHGPDPEAVLLAGNVCGRAGVAMSSDNRWLATAAQDDTALVWDLANIRQHAEPAFILKGHEQEVTAIAFSPNNQWLVTGGRDGSARLWAMSAQGPSTTPIVLSGHEEGIIAAAISSDSRWLATGSGSIDVSFSFSAGMSYVLSSLADSSPKAEIRLWNIGSKDPPSESVPLRGHTASITSLTFSSDNEWLISASADNTVRLWKPTLDQVTDFAERVVGRGFTAEEWDEYFGG